MRDGSGMKYPAPYRLLWTIAVILLRWESESPIAFSPRVFCRCFGCKNAMSAPWFGLKMFLEQNSSANLVETRAVLFIRALSAVNKPPIHESVMWAQLEHQVCLEVIQGVAYASGRAGRWPLTKCLDAGKQVCPALSIMCR
jgi:hypothetical protein